MSIARRRGRLNSLSGLGRRFDGVALRPPAARAGEAHRLRARPVTARALQAWCHSGPTLAVGRLCAAAGAENDEVMAWADAFAREIDGSQRLDALPGTAARLAFRLAVKCRDVTPWRPRRPTDPWDAGWLIDTPTALQHLQAHWRPRRATLLLADTALAATLQTGLVALQRRAAELHHPLRWLWVGLTSGEHMIAAPAVQRFDLD